MLSNPFIAIQVVLMFISLSWAYYMDGADMPQRKYNFKQTAIGMAVSLVLLMGAVNWAATH